MSEQELQEYLEAVRKALEKDETPDEARQKLIEEGFITEEGELSPEYR